MLTRRVGNLHSERRENYQHFNSLIDFKFILKQIFYFNIRKKISSRNQMITDRFWSIQALIKYTRSISLDGANMAYFESLVFQLKEILITFFSRLLAVMWD